MYRKIAIICISVFFRVTGVITQALVMFIMLILFLILNIKLLPFAFKSLNDMEMMSIITTMLTIYCGLFFISHQPEVYHSSDTKVKEADNGLRISEGAQLFFFFVILFSNIGFFIYWLYKMVGEARNTFRKKLTKVYLWIWLCGNRGKLEEEIRKRIIQDEHDLLYEKFQKQISALKKIVRSSKKKLVLTEENIEKSMIYLNPQNYINIVGDSNITSERLNSFLSSLNNKEPQSILIEEVKMENQKDNDLENENRDLQIEPQFLKIKNQASSRKEVYQLMPSEEEKVENSQNQNECLTPAQYSINIYDRANANSNVVEPCSGYETTAKLRSSDKTPQLCSNSRSEYLSKDGIAISLPDIECLSSEEKEEPFSTIPVLPRAQFYNRESTQE